MKKVTKKLPMAVAIATALSLSFVTIHQSGVIQGLKGKLGLTEDKLERSENALTAERELVKTLIAEKEVLEDSISYLNEEIGELNLKIADQKATIAYQSKKIKKLEDNVTGLTKQIADMKKKGSSDSAAIKKLETERDRLLIDMENLDRQRMEVMKQKERVETERKKEKKQLDLAENKQQEIQEKIENPSPVVRPEKKKTNTQPFTSPTLNKEIRDEVNAEVKTREQERIRKIVTGTSVDFIEFSLHMKNDGKPLEKLKRDGWKSTILKVDLNNANQDAIVDEEFIVQIFDLDNNKVVPVNESNLQYPDSNRGSLGYKFNYEGTPTTINYFNSQKKTGSNFELRLFYMKNGVLFPLKNGTMRIVNDGQVM